MWNVLHVPTITNNLVSVGRIVKQGMQVRFTHLGCFIQEEGKIIAQGRREGRMFILAANDIGTTMFVKGQKVESYMDLWHKRSHQLPATSRDVDAKHHFRLAEIQRTEGPSLRSLLVREATSTSIP